MDIDIDKLLLIFDPAFDNLDFSIQNEAYLAFNALVYNLVFSYVKNHHSAQDIIQESFLKALKSPPQNVDVNKICFWLKTLAKNNAINHVRKHQRMIPTVFDNDSFENRYSHLNETLEQTLEKKEIFETLMDCVSQLPKQLKLILFLYCYENLSYRKISEKLKVSEGSVRQSLYRARKAIKEEFTIKWGK
ncbi:RNA polymerase sigma factor [Cohnella laeviribosi]|jgi:RNA polymerase sigma-70 factor (ECF subfamily)|uniref:RNA polymerase sigma factor n=1 Tax=Cohnella laeviribosi TaxID=380174 RepID=UPI003D2252F9